MRSGESLSHAIQKRVIQEALFIVRSLDWDTLTADVEFKHAPGLKAFARIATISGSGGTLYPPLKVGDVVKGEIHGPDLGDMMRTKKAAEPKNPYLYDRSDVTIGLSVYADSGEPAGRKAATPPPEGGWLLVADDGSEIRFDPVTKEWVWKLPAGSKLYLGGKTGAQAVARNGDPAGIGSVSATQSQVYVGGP